MFSTLFRHFPLLSYDTDCLNHHFDNKQGNSFGTPPFVSHLYSWRVTLDIQESIIHRVIKAKDTSGPASVQIRPRNTLLNIDERVNKLGRDVLKLYGKLSNGYGILGADFNTHRFPKFLDDHINDVDSFTDFSCKTLPVIAEEMSEKRFTTTSYPIFFRYTNNGRDWILIAVLKLKEGVGIDENTLDLNDSVFLI